MRGRVRPHPPRRSRERGTPGRGAGAASVPRHSPNPHRVPAKPRIQRCGCTPPQAPPQPLCPRPEPVEGPPPTAHSRSSPDLVAVTTPRPLSPEPPRTPPPPRQAAQLPPPTKIEQHAKDRPNDHNDRQQPQEAKPPRFRFRRYRHRHSGCRRRGCGGGRRRRRGRGRRGGRGFRRWRGRRRRGRGRRRRRRRRGCRRWDRRGRRLRRWRGRGFRRGRCRGLWSAWASTSAQGLAAGRRGTACGPRLCVPLCPGS